MQEFKETHQQGNLSVENHDVINELDMTDCDFGVQVSRDGRVWVCVNGIAWLRFKPAKRADRDLRQYYFKDLDGERHYQPPSQNQLSALVYKFFREENADGIIFDTLSTKEVRSMIFALTDKDPSKDEFECMIRGITIGMSLIDD